MYRCSNNPPCVVAQEWASDIVDVVKYVMINGEPHYVQLSAEECS